MGTYRSLPVLDLTECEMGAAGLFHSFSHRSVGSFRLDQACMYDVLRVLGLSVLHCLPLASEEIRGHFQYSLSLAYLDMLHQEAGDQQSSARLITQARRSHAHAPPTRVSTTSSWACRSNAPDVPYNHTLSISHAYAPQPAQFPAFAGADLQQPSCCERVP